MAIFNCGKGDLKFSAALHSAGSEQRIVLRGEDGHYPLLGLHMSVEEAEHLAAEISAAIAEARGLAVAA